MNLQNVSNYSLKNMVLAKHGRKCVDGRYASDDENIGMLARPGADFGYVMTMLAYSNEQKLGLTPTECTKNIYEIILMLDDAFYTHTDGHENKELPHSVGCGHAAKPTEEEHCGSYELNADDVKQAIKFFRTEKDLKLKIVELEGKHQEKGVLIINSDEYSVASKDKDNMFFIYDKKRDDQFMKKIVEKLVEDNLVYEDFQRIATTQLTASLQLLAKGLPIFEIDFLDPFNPKVEFKGNV